MEAKLLAGPILRRTTKNRICVWLAATGQLQLQLTVMDGDEKTLGASRIENLGKENVRLGKSLYVYLLQARAYNEEGFPLNALLFYRLDCLDPESGAASSLFSEEELANLTYGGFKYPSFFITSELKYFLHGSCRKPHGGFDSKEQARMPDALSHGHTLMSECFHDLERRPALLLLTGDQIYADDVALSLLAMLRVKSLTLTSGQERLPLSSNPVSPSWLDPSAIPLHGRKDALRDKSNSDGRSSGLSSGESENHLFTFGEFAAMYIYSFGNVPAWEPVWDWQTLAGIGAAEGAFEAWEKQLEPLSFFDNTLPDVRRLLANIPTYMTFDDHDVTDDWNISLDWYDKVRYSPLGRRIVSNGLAAYWAFQAWGNDPDNFDKDLVFSIEQHLNNETDDPDISEYYDLHTWKSRGWGFSVPTNPPVIAVDSRTQRQYESRYFPAQLLDRYALDWLRIEWSKLKTMGTINKDICPIFITSTPVMGYSPVEFIQSLALWIARFVDNYKWISYLEKIMNKEGFIMGFLVNKLDVESWTANKDGFVRFMETLSSRMGLQNCIFLSGDVHYAFSARANIEHDDKTLKCFQFTSSALCNEPNAMQSRFLEETSKKKDEVKDYYYRAKKIDGRWKAAVELLKIENSGLRVNAKCNIGLVELEKGRPVKHTLLTGSGKLVCPCK